MFYKIPTTVYFENDCVNVHKDVFKEYGKKALIVTGKHSSYLNGSFDDVTKALNSLGITYDVFDQVEENPSVQTIEKAYSLNKDKDIDFVIGLGGGSNIDAAKAIAVMLYFNFEDGYKLYENVISQSSLPVIAIATTCGTGSEVTAASVLTNDKILSKASITYRIYPKVALLDSKYLKTLPINTLKYTSLDALGHLIESYISSKATRFSDMITLEGFRVWSNNVKAFDRYDDLTSEDFDNFLLSSTYGGMAIALCGTNLPHGLSYTLTYNENIPHGKAVGYFLYGLMKYADSKRVNDILSCLGFSDLEKFKDFLVNKFELNKVSGELLNKAVDELIGNKKKLTYCPYEVDKELLEKVAYSLWTD